MAKEYVLLVDETKVTDKLNNKVPVVLDIIPEAVNYVTSQVEAMGATVKKRDEHLLEVYYDTIKILALFYVRKIYRILQSINF